MALGLIFNVQRFSLHDGPGLRTTVFMKGCPLSCPWCHNPESRSPLPELVRLGHRCMRCGRCDEAELTTPAVRGRDLADVDACPTGALQAIGVVVEVDDLVRDVLRDRVFYDQSGGGVTFSGGEPLMQAVFVGEAMRRLRDEGVRTALDTCGHASWDDLERVAAVASLVLYDLKLFDERRHRAATGASNAIILRNLEALCEVHADIWIRIPVIPGVNDDEENLVATARFLQRLRGISRVELLPYHATGEAKFARAGLPYTLKGTLPPSVERLEQLSAPFRDAGLPAAIGGHA
jgi:pyruvate formate lyase activating enzyme